MPKNKKKWIQAANLNKGALHRALGVPEDMPIPVKKMQKAMHSKNPKIKKMAMTAKTLKSFK